jgi:hypothetical protein
MRCDARAVEDASRHIRERWLRKMTTSGPRLTEADARLVIALTESSGRFVPLRNLIHDYDWLNRAVPSYDDLSYGIQRLVAAGYAITSESSTGDLLFAATPQSTQLRRSAKAHPAVAIRAALRTQITPVEDRSLGRLRGLTPQAVEAAVAAHASWIDRWSRPLVALAWLLGRR